MKEIKNYEKACEAILLAFVKKYFEDPEDPEDFANYVNFYWIGNEIGGVFFVNDWYFSLNDALVALKNNASYSQLINYREMEMEIYNNEEKFGDRKFFSLENYLKYPNNFIINEKNLDFKII